MYSPLGFKKESEFWAKSKWYKRYSDKSNIMVPEIQIAYGHSLKINFYFVAYSKKTLFEIYFKIG